MTELTLGQRLKAAREAANLSQGDVAQALDVHSVTVSKWEREVQRPSADFLDRLAELYKVPSRDLLRGERLTDDGDAVTENVSRGTGEAWEPNPSLRAVVPARVYEVAIAYCRRLSAAGLPREEVEEAERLLIDEGYAKLNKRAKRVLTEDEQIEMIDATWRIMREALSWRGMRA